MLSLPSEQTSSVDICDFVGLLRHTRGDFAGKPFALESWQTDYLTRLLNTKRPDGLRQYRRSLLALPRKQGKTQMAAALGLYMTFCDDVGAEVIVAAGDRSQASLLHTAAKQLLESCPALTRRAKIYRNSIVVPETNSSMFVISSEAGTKHGYNPSCVLIDEYHVFRDRELVDVLETGMGARSQPLTIYITTAGIDLLGPCYADWQYAEKVRDGVVEDPTFLPCIFAAPSDANPFLEETWRQANPNYGITVKPDYFQQMADRAKRSVAEESVFKTLHLNIWNPGGEERYFRHGAWEACDEPVRDVGTRPCYCGLDLASTSDTTAFVAVWPDDDGSYDCMAHLFVPEEKAGHDNEDRVPYRQWERDGFCTITEGNITDFDVVRDYVLSFCERNDVRCIGIDRWNAVHLTTQLAAEGVVVKPYGQGFASMSAPTKMLETLVLGKRLRHGGVPHLRWQASNLQCRVDDAGNVKPSKKHSKSTARIDAMVALIMALGLASAEDHGPFDEPSLVVL